MVGKVCSPLEVKVHSQEAYVRRDIGITHSIVEFHRIKNVDAISHKNISGMDISMAFSNSAFRHSPSENRGVQLDEILNSFLDEVEFSLGNCVINKLNRLNEILCPIRLHNRITLEPANPPLGIRSRMKLRHNSSNFINKLLVTLPFFQKPAQ